MAATVPLAEEQRNPRLNVVAENKEDVQLIWLDANIDKSTDRIYMKSTLLALNPVAQFFTDSDQCVNLIKSIVYEQVLLILSGSFARTILPQLHSHRALNAIFIFDENRENYTSLMNEYTAIVDIFTDEDCLLISIKETMNVAEKQTLVFNLFDKKQRTTRDLSKESASFLWHQMLLYVLKQMPQNEKSKQDMLDMCLNYYRSNKNELKKINKFQTSYTSDKAIEWYTDECFLYKLLNKALRTEDIELLYLFRFFIIDLCAALQKESLKLKNKGLQTLYRGQRIPTAEFEKLKQNIGTVISTNGFFSTSRNIGVALNFASRGPMNDAFQIVLFEIQADASLTTVVFADIEDKTMVRGEQEVLFNLSAVFKIDSFEFDSSLGLWKVQLIATDESSDKIQQYVNLSKQQLEESSPIIYFGRLLRDELGQVNRADKYFRTILDSLPPDHPETASVYNQIGIVHQKRSELKLSLEYFERAYKIRKEKLSPDHPHIAASLYNIGTIHRRKENFESALDYFQQALQIYEINSPDDTMEKITTIECIGRVYSDKNELDTALIYFNRALDMHKRILPDQHPNLARCLGAIGWVYKKMGNLDLALDYFHQTLQMEEKCLPLDHPNLSDHLGWIVNTYKSMGSPEKALEFCYEWLDIQKNTVGESHPCIARTLMTMANMLQDNESRKALEYYEQALSIVENSIPPDNQTAFYCLSGMGRLHNKNNMLEDALRCNLKAVEFHRRVLSPDHTHLADLLKNIGFCYRNTHKTQEALRYFNESLAIYRVNYEPEHEKIKKLEAQIARLSRNRNSTVNTRTTRVTTSERSSNTLNSNSNSNSRVSQQTSTSMPKSSSEVKETSTKLDLSHDQIGCEGAQYVADLIRDNTTYTVLSLSNSQIGDLGALYIAAALTHNTTLLTLDLTSNQIGNEGAQYLADALRHNSTLAILDLSQNRIQYRGTQHLADALHHNTTLTSLNFEDNEITDEGAEHLAHALSFNATLTSLTLRRNQVGDQGAQHLANALTLITLNLGDNQIRTEGAHYLADVLPYNITLRTLNLERNQIGDEGAQLLGDALRYNATLTEVDLSWNRIEYQGVKRLVDALQHNKTLVTVNLRGNEIGTQGIHYLNDASKRGIVFQWNTD